MKKCKLFLVYALILFSIMIGSVQAMTVKEIEPNLTGNDIVKVEINAGGTDVL